MRALIVFSVLLFFASILFLVNFIYLFPIYLLIKRKKEKFGSFIYIKGKIKKIKEIKTLISKKSVAYYQAYFEEYTTTTDSEGLQSNYFWAPKHFLQAGDNFYIQNSYKKVIEINSIEITKFNFLVDNKEMAIIDQPIESVDFSKINKLKIKKMKITDFLNENNSGYRYLKTHKLGQTRVIEKYLDYNTEMTVIAKNNLSSKKYKLIYITDSGPETILKKIKNSFFSSLFLSIICLVFGILILLI